MIGIYIVIKGSVSQLLTYGNDLSFYDLVNTFKSASRFPENDTVRSVTIVRLPSSSSSPFPESFECAYDAFMAPDVIHELFF